MSRKLLTMEKTMSREDAAEKIHEIADKLGEGHIELKSGNDSVKLQPAGNIEFELDVEKEEDGDMSVEIEIEWPENQTGNDLQIE